MRVAAAVTFDPVRKAGIICNMYMTSRFHYVYTESFVVGYDSF